MIGGSCRARRASRSFSAGQGRGKAHREISEKYDVEFACAAGPCLPESRAAYVGTVGGCSPTKRGVPFSWYKASARAEPHRPDDPRRDAQWKALPLCNFQHSPSKRRRRSAAAAHPRGGRSGGRRDGHAVAAHGAEGSTSTTKPARVGRCWPTTRNQGGEREKEEEEEAA